MIKVEIKEEFKKNITYAFFILSVPIICIFPKINIISIPGFWQGMQLSDILIFIFLIFLIFNIQNIKINFGNQFNNLFIFFPYIIFTSIIAIFLSNDSQSNVHGILSFNTSVIILIRFIEYFFFIILALTYFDSKKYLIIFFKLFIIINFMFAFLQEYNLIGFINSRGYFSPGDYRIGGRPIGLTGGPWELGASTSLAFYGIFFLRQKKIDFDTVFYFILTSLCLIIAETKSNIIGFAFSLIFLNYNFRFILLFMLSIVGIYIFSFINLINIGSLVFILASLIIYITYKRIYYSIIFLISMFIFSYIVSYIFQNNYFLQKLISLDFTYLIQLFYNFLIYGHVPLQNSSPDLHLYYSLILRLEYWLPILNEFKSNSFNMIFGLGNQKIYYESFILRCIFTFGILGSIIIIYLSRKLPLFFIVFTVFAGITFDLYFSSKVFFLTILFFLAYKSFKNNKHS